MRRYPLTGPPRVLRQRSVMLSNFTLAPGSALPFKAHWKAVARSLPQGSALVVLPKGDSRGRQAFETVARLRQKEGRSVTRLPEEELQRQAL